MRSYTHRPTLITAAPFDPANIPSYLRAYVVADSGAGGGGRSRYRVHLFGVTRDVEPGDMIVATPNQCWYTMTRERFAELYATLDTPLDAARLLLDVVKHIQVCGFDVAGIDPSAVRITPRTDLPDLDELGDPTPSPLGRGPGRGTPQSPARDAPPPALDGDLSSCCGQLLQRTGTCQTCTACGTSEGGCG